MYLYILIDIILIRIILAYYIVSTPVLIQSYEIIYIEYMNIDNNSYINFMFDIDITRYYNRHTYITNWYYLMNNKALCHVLHK